MTRFSTSTFFAALTSAMLLAGASQAMAADHTNMQECLDYGSNQCNGDPNYPDCIDFTISECEDTYLPFKPSGAGQLSATQVRRAKIQIRSFRTRAMSIWKKKHR